MGKLVHGVGVNDANYKVTFRIKGEINWVCPYYSKWKDMLRRCYSDSYQKEKPTYIGCSVFEEWLTFSNFKRWMEQQDWEGKQLDKDLLVYQNKIYSPKTCCFASKEINQFMVKCDALRGAQPLGVCKVTYESGIIRFVAFIRDKTKQHYLGNFLTPFEAHRAWQEAKITQTGVYIEKYNKEANIIRGLERVLTKIQNDYDNNLITEDF